MLGQGVTCRSPLVTASHHYSPAVPGGGGHTLTPCDGHKEEQPSFISRELLLLLGSCESPVVGQPRRVLEGPSIIRYRIAAPIAADGHGIWTR